MFRRGALPAACTIAVAAGSAAAAAADPALVARFARLSDQFHAQLPRSDISGLDASGRQQRADCILSGFEARHGAAGLRELMSMMSVLARGAQFDDQTIIDFNARFGRDYDRIEMECTRRALGS